MTFLHGLAAIWESLFPLFPSLSPTAVLDLGGPRGDLLHHQNVFGRGPFVRPPESGRPNRGSRNSLASAFRVLFVGAGSTTVWPARHKPRDRGGWSERRPSLFDAEASEHGPSPHRTLAREHAILTSLAHRKGSVKSLGAKTVFILRPCQHHYICPSSCARRPVCNSLGGWIENPQTSVHETQQPEHGPSWPLGKG